jgi:hypothetical protein
MAMLPEGYTIRKFGNTLKVVPMRRKKVAIVKENINSVDKCMDT